MSVKLRINKKKYLYLDIYHNSVRKWEKLDLQLTGDKSTDKNILRVAEECRVQKEIQIVRGEYELIDHTGAKRTLYSYIEEIAKTRDKKDRPTKILKYVKQYPDGDVIQLKQITSTWLESFQDYLLDLFDNP